MKSGVMPVASIALQMAKKSVRRPTHSLKPVGLPPLSVRSRSTNCSRPMGSPNSVCDGGETTVSAGLDQADAGDLRRHLDSGQHAAVPGLGALRQLQLDHLDGRAARGDGERLGSKRPSRSRQPK
jgi:hypothetical protein